MIPNNFNVIPSPARSNLWSFVDESGIGKKNLGGRRIAKKKAKE